MSPDPTLGSTIRVAVVIPAHWDYAIGGAEYQAKLLVECLHKDHQADITWFAVRVGSRREFPDHRVQSVGQNDRWRKYGHFWDYFRLPAALHRFGPDVIYQRVSCSYAGIAARYARKHGIPMISHISSENDCRLAPPIRALLRRPHAIVESRLAKSGIARADMLVAQTRDQVRLVRENYGRDARLIRNFHPVPSVPDKPRDRFTIAWVANLKELKRPELMLEIADSLAANDRIEIVLCGQPFPVESVQSAFEDAVSTHPNVTYTGPLSQDEANSLLDRASVLVNTSRFEGFSNVFVQAWMRAVPVLTLGVNPDGLLDGGSLGQAFANTSELASYTRALAADFDRLAKMGRDCRAFATTQFSMSNAAELATLIAETARNR